MARALPLFGLVIASAATLVLLGAGQEAGPTKDTLKTLARQRLDLARRGLETVEKPPVRGAQGYHQATWVWANRVLAAELAVSSKRSERIAALQAFVKRARDLEQTAREGLTDKIYTVPEVLDAQYNLLMAQMQLAEAELDSSAQSR